LPVLVTRRRRDDLEPDTVCKLNDDVRGRFPQVHRGYATLAQDLIGFHGRINRRWQTKLLKMVLPRQNDPVPLDETPKTINTDARRCPKGEIPANRLMK
jgi:hypothetical protein